MRSETCRANIRDEQTQSLKNFVYFLDCIYMSVIHTCLYKISLVTNRMLKLCRLRFTLRIFGPKNNDIDTRVSTYNFVWRTRTRFNKMPLTERKVTGIVRQNYNPPKIFRFQVIFVMLAYILIPSGIVLHQKGGILCP